VCRFKGTIYIADKDTPETLARRRNQTQREELMGYWGYKFEDYATRPRTGTDCAAHTHDRIRPHMHDTHGRHQISRKNRTKGR
jgi:hypothetical protein